MENGVSRVGRVPLVLVAGFLGAGKTSVLRALIPELIRQKRTPVVVINDFQNAAVDAERLRELQVAVSPVSGSCVCCGSRDELMEILAGLELPENAVVLLEANGTTDTANLIELLTLDRRAQRYDYPVELCVIDAKRWGKRMFYDFLEKAQLETASYVYVSREDQVKPARWQEVLKQVTEFNPHAENVSVGEFCKKLIAAVGTRGGAHGDEAQHEHEHGHGGHSHEGHEHGHGEHHGHSHEEHHFASMEVLLPAVVTRTDATLWLESLPEGVLRVKGLVKLEDAGWHVFEMVQGFREIIFHAVKGEPSVSPRAVLIGPRLSREAVESAFCSVWPRESQVFV